MVALLRLEPTPSPDRLMDPAWWQKPKTFANFRAGRLQGLTRGKPGGGGQEGASTI